VIQQPAQYKVLMFKTPSCRSCHAMMPLVYTAMDDGENIQVIDASELEHRGKVVQYDIHSVPTFIKLDDGVEIERHVGAMPMREFFDFIGE